jgi:uncharacterized membrane protein
MSSDKKYTCMIMCIFTIIMIQTQQKVESALNLRKFGISFINDETIEKSADEHLKQFQEQIHSDQKKLEEKEIEMKRKEVFIKYLVSRVSGSILKDFCSRF